MTITTPKPKARCDVETLTVRAIVQSLIELHGSENAAAIASGISRRSIRRMAGSEPIKESPRPITYQRLAQHLAELEVDETPVIVHGHPVLCSPAELFEIGEREFESLNPCKKALVRHISLHLNEEDCSRLLIQLQRCMMDNSGTRDKSIDGLMRSLNKPTASTLQSLIEINIDERFFADEPRAAYTRLLETDDSDLVDAIASLMEDSHLPTGDVRYRLFEVLAAKLYKADENGLTQSRFAGLDDLLLFLTSD